MIFKQWDFNESIVYLQVTYLHLVYKKYGWVTLLPGIKDI